ncbi:MAG: hypothetical protein COW87_02750 [Candidatus Levybacteria bacterium CG22_combo_CG10-13_8_21_14_all_35_11]|nr:MAG: hypothetical protein COW87_02750 [Candidatus Levybacteria bacterium CG22_combo_CG10-13_8_21_14_all_35_11]
MDSKKGPVKSWFASIIHNGRESTSDSLAGLSEFSRIADAHGLEMVKAATSGRTSEVHETTVDFLNSSGYADHFSEVNLNPDKKTHSWKEDVARRKLNEGYDMVVHLDDDIRAAMSVARVDEYRVIVFLIKNWSNAKPLLWIGEKRGLQLPPNIYFADDVLDASRIFEQAILEKAA